MSTTLDPAVGTLAGQEIRHYLKSRLFWVGAGLLLIMSVPSLASPDERGSTSLDGLAPAALLGVLGLVVMVGLTRNSDRAAAVAGAVSVPQRSRTLALAAAVVVPAAFGLIWFALATIAYLANPPDASGPFGPADDAFVLATMFAQGVMSCIGGPLLGLLLARWVPGRGVAPVAAVVLVLVTILLQGVFEFTRGWREIWPWTHFHGPIGTSEDSDRWLVLPGSPYWYIAYLAALCVLGVLVAVYRDPEADRARLRYLILGTLAVAVVLTVLSMIGGADSTVVSQVPSSAGG
jgi:hypothetical protein